MRAANAGLTVAVLLATAHLNAGLAPALAEDKVVNVYNWSDLISAETLEAFTAATGIKVQYDTYDSDEVLETKLLTGGSGYDVVAPSATYLPHQIQAGVLMELDRTKIPNWSNLDPGLLKMVEATDPGNKHAIIFDWGSTGLIINTQAVAQHLPDTPTDSYALLFDPANAEKLKDCGIAVLDSPADVVPIVLKYLGLSPDSEKPEDLAKAKAALLAIRPYLRSIHSSSYLNDLANGSLCAAIGWSGDATIAQARANEAKNGVHLQYIVPKEGTLSWFGMMAIPADAPDPDTAHAFLNYMLEPKVAADFTSSVGYANAVPKSAAFMKPEIANDPTTFPPEDVKLRLFPSVTASQAYDRERTRAWTDFKTGQ